MQETLVEDKKKREIIRKDNIRRLDSKEKKVAQQLPFIGHEVKSPLTRILALSEFMLNEIPGELNEEQKEYMQDIYNNSYLLMNSINSLLNLSKSEHDYLTLNISPCDIKELIENVVIKIDSIAASKNTYIYMDMPDEPLIVNLDKEKIEQVIFNLLDNAFKFTENGRVIIKVEADKPVKDYLTVSVCDTGVGIDEKIKDKVFDKFFTEKNAMNPCGSGLGLALVKEFVELHAGSVWINSKCGEGTSIHFTLSGKLNKKKGELPSDVCGC